MSTTKDAAKAKEAEAEKATETNDEGTKVKAGKKSVRQFTYVGKGEGSPYVINLMGKQTFVRGQLTEVTDPELLAKLDGGMATFVEGKADPELLHQIDQEAKEAGDAARAADIALNAKFTKKYRTE